jgi:hypothetical protein
MTPAEAHRIGAAVYARCAPVMGVHVQGRAHALAVVAAAEALGVPCQLVHRAQGAHERAALAYRAKLNLSPALHWNRALQPSEPWLARRNGISSAFRSRPYEKCRLSPGSTLTAAPTRI